MARKGYSIGKAWFNADGTLTIATKNSTETFASVSCAVNWCRENKVDAYFSSSAKPEQRGVL